MLDEGDLGLDSLFADISPDGSQLAVGSRSQVGVLDLGTGHWVRTPLGRTHMVIKMADAPDGGTVATSGFGGRVNIWGSATGALLASVIPGPPDVAANLEFLPHGHTVIISAQNGNVYTWDTEIEHWIKFACC